MTPLRLTLSTTDGRSRSIDLDGERLVIGRAADSGLVLDDPEVSRAHAEILRTADGGLELRDLGSANGTFVDGVPITGPVRLYGGERLQIGPFEGRVDGLAEPRPEPPRPARTETELDTRTPGELAGAGSPGPLRLAVTAGVGAGRLLELGEGRFVIGRDASCDLTVDDPKVSGEHAEIIRSGSSFVLRDLGSTNGTYVNGSRVREPVALEGGDQLRVGNTQLQAVPGGAPFPAAAGTGRAASQSAILRVQTNLQRQQRLVLILAGVAVAIAAAAVLAVVTGVFGGDDGSGQLSADEVRDLQRAVVQVDMIGEDGRSIGFGSGTIIDPKGRILTNAHVGKPDAPGLALIYGPSEDAPPKYLLIKVFESDDRPVVPMYRAEVVAYDGYVDAAVLQITSDENGQPIDPGELDLPSVPLGDSDALSTGDPITVIGFPGIAGGSEGQSNSFPGSVSGFLEDERIKSTRRGYIRTDADVFPGNSGGLAADGEGRLVGIPSSQITNADEQSRANHLRPVALVKPMIEAAEAGREWKSPYFVYETGNENVSFRGWAAGEPDSSCAYQAVGSGGYPSGTKRIFAVYSFGGVAKGENYQIVWLSRQGSGDPQVEGRFEGTFQGDDLSCGWYSLTDDQGLADAVYVAVPRLGPSLRVLEDADIAGVNVGPVP
jgi:putative serine protease PepD